MSASCRQAGSEFIRNVRRERQWFEKVTIEGNEAAAYSAYKTSEVVAILSDYAIVGYGRTSGFLGRPRRENLWGTVPQVVEMQSEGGAAVRHGAVLTGAMTTTFTASQGLLLMIPNLYKIAGN